MRKLQPEKIEYLLQFPFLQEQERELGELLLALGRGEVTWTNVLVHIEILDVLSVVYLPLVEALQTSFDSNATVVEREVQLRLWTVLLHKMGKYWNKYRTEENEDTIEGTITFVIQEGEKEKIEKQTWFNLLSLLLEAREGLRVIPTSNLIQEGMKQEISMIIDMLTPQKRTIFTPYQQWKTDALVFRKIEEKDHFLLQKHFTPVIGHYLSIDSFSHPLLVSAYIQQSQEEMKQGTCLVLLAFEQDSQYFVGGVTLNDINRYSVEIGLWVSEEQQGKGYGTALLEQAIAIVEKEIPTQEIIYTVEKGNNRSIALCEKMGFVFERELILEPTSLKNKYREMLRYSKEVEVI